MLAAEIGFVVQSGPAQAPGREFVFVGARGAADYAGIQLGMFANAYLVAVLPSEQPGLLFHAVKVRLELVLADAKRRTPAHRAKCEAGASATLVCLES